MATFNIGATTYEIVRIVTSDDPKINGRIIVRDVTSTHAAGLEWRNENIFIDRRGDGFYFKSWNIGTPLAASFNDRINAAIAEFNAASDAAAAADAAQAIAADTVETIDRAIAGNVYITDEHVAKSAKLRRVAMHFVSTYRGTNSFVQDVAIKLADDGSLSIARMRGALNVMVREAKIERDAAIAAAARQRAAEERAARAVLGLNDAGGVFIDMRSASEREYDAAMGDGAADNARRERLAAAILPDTMNGASAKQAEHEIISVERVVPNGFYTIILNDAGDYRTLRVTDADVEKFSHLPAGAQIVSVLSGEDNTSSYTGFAFLKGDDLAMWKKFRNARDLSMAVHMLVRNVENAAAEFVKRSNRCFICNRPLTTPESIAAGIGPICRENMGIEFDFGKLATARAQAQAERDAIDAANGSEPAAARQRTRERIYAEIDELFN